MKNILIILLASIVSFGLSVGCVPTAEIPSCSLFQDDFERWRNIDFPLVVEVDEEFSESARNTIFASLETWNHVVGEKVFVLSSKDEEANVVIEHAELGCVPVCVVGITVRNFRNDTFFLKTAEVHLNEVPEARMLEITVHELGHVLGLRHDCDESSTMSHSAIGGQIQEKDIVYVRWQMM